MDRGMIFGMGLIVFGVGLTAYGLPPGRSSALDTGVRVTPSEEAPLTLAHAWLIIVLIVALVVDIMKPASLGFVVPGMRAEYAISKAAVAWLPFSALLGTFVGSLVMGRSGRYLWPARGDPAVGDHVRGHLDLRGDAVVRMECGHVFHHGRRGGGPVARGLCPAGGDHAHPSSRLEPGPGRRTGRGGRLSRLERLLGHAAADVRLADHVVPEPAHRPAADRHEQPDPGVGQIPSAKRARGGGRADSQAIRIGPAADRRRPDRRACLAGGRQGSLR